MKNNSNGGVGFFGLLFIAFLVLKLTAVIEWSWWWVTAPLWGPIAIAIAIVLPYILFKVSVIFFEYLMDAYEDAQRAKQANQ